MSTDDFEPFTKQRRLERNAEKTELHRLLKEGSQRVVLAPGARLPENFKQIVLDGELTRFFQCANCFEVHSLTDPIKYKVRALVLHTCQDDSIRGSALNEYRIEWVPSARQGDMLCINDFLFQRSNNKIYKMDWVCVKAADKSIKCTVSAATDSNNVLVRLNREHNHPPDISKLFYKKTLAALKKRSTEQPTKGTAEIYNETVAELKAEEQQSRGLSVEQLTELFPKYDFIKHSITKAKRASLMKQAETSEDLAATTTLVAPGELQQYSNQFNTFDNQQTPGSLVFLSVVDREETVASGSPSKGPNLAESLLSDMQTLQQQPGMTQMTPVVTRLTDQIKLRDKEISGLKLELATQKTRFDKELDNLRQKLVDREMELQAKDIQLLDVKAEHDKAKVDCAKLEGKLEATEILRNVIFSSLSSKKQ